MGRTKSEAKAKNTPAHRKAGNRTAKRHATKAGASGATGVRQYRARTPRTSGFTGDYRVRQPKARPGLPGDLEADNVEQLGLAGSWVNRHPFRFAMLVLFLTVAAIVGLFLILEAAAKAVLL